VNTQVIRLAYRANDGDFPLVHVVSDEADAFGERQRLVGELAELLKRV
jgi:hypothetical protein